MTYVPGQPMNYKKTTLIIEALIDPSAIVGERSIVWHYARILAKVVIGNDCSIGGGTEIGRGSTIGDRSRIGANCFLPPNSRIGADVFVGPGVTCTDDRHPHCGNAGYTAEPPTIGDGASVGAGVVILPGRTIGKKARVAAGSIVTADVPDGCFAIGAPARLKAMPSEWSPLREDARDVA
jgi:UDP-2-acetamido-3-amino-2,3-dideoxy-glucuronate N-acetyltransferase